MKRKYWGFAAAASSAVLYGVTPVLVRMAYAYGASSMTVVCLRSGLAMPLLCLLFFGTRRRGEKLAPTKREAAGFLLLGVVGVTLTSILLYGAYRFIPVGMATTLHFVYPVLVNVGCIVLFHERAGGKKLAALCLAMAGVALFMEAGPGANYLGVALALASGVCYAFYIVFMASSGLGALNPFKVTFYLNAFCCAATVVAGLFTRQLVLGLPAAAWGYILLVVLVDSIFASVLLLLGVRYAGASSASILCTLEPITSVLLGFAVLREAMTVRKLTGCACILTAILIIAAAEVGKERKPSAEQKK